MAGGSTSKQRAVEGDGALNIHKGFAIHSHGTLPKHYKEKWGTWYKSGQKTQSKWSTKGEGVGFVGYLPDECDVSGGGKTGDINWVGGSAYQYIA